MTSDAEVPLSSVGQRIRPLTRASSLETCHQRSRSAVESLLAEGPSDLGTEHSVLGS